MEGSKDTHGGRCGRPQRLLKAPQRAANGAGYPPRATGGRYGGAGWRTEFVVVEEVWSMNYPEWTKSQLMLLLLWNKLQKAYDDGDSELRLYVVRGGPETGVHAGNPAVNVSDEISELSRGGEAISVFDRLWREGYVHVSFGSQSPSFAHTSPVLYSLSTAGLIDIGKFPNPDEKLAHAFEAARELLAQEPSIPPDEKRDMLDTVTKVTALLNDVRGLGQAVAQGLGPGVGGG